MSSESEGERTRVRVVVKGRVQGVCFRMETQLEAERVGVTGWVRNSADGNVEGVFEGASEAVGLLLKWCHRGPPLAKVTEVEVRHEEAVGDFSGFTVRY